MGMPSRPRGHDRRHAASAADIEHPFSRRDGGRAE
jgi:hypothetical protein